MIKKRRINVHKMKQKTDNSNRANKKAVSEVMSLTMSQWSPEFASLVVGTILCWD